jgi:hypothetical protein
MSLTNDRHQTSTDSSRLWPADEIRAGADQAHPGAELGEVSLRDPDPSSRECARFRSGALPVRVRSA